MKAHVITIGNETADRLEKEGVGLDVVDVQMQMSAQSVKTGVNQKTFTLWKKRFDETNKSTHVYWFLPKMSKKIACTTRLII